MVRIGVLTSSRADFGVYLPLLRAFKLDPEIIFEIIAFGSHLSNLHGKTIDEIENLGFEIHYSIPSMLDSDSVEAISSSAALTSLKFSSFWGNHKNDFDLVLCLGDRYEMFSAVAAGIPFGIKFAHFYGGDYSKGAIDNFYRNGLTHASILHFTSNKKCAKRVQDIIGETKSIEIIGILSLEGIENQEYLSVETFKSKWSIDLSIPTILVTLHPETVNYENNFKHSCVIKEVLSDIQIEYQIVITMPNADTESSAYRKVFNEVSKEFPNKIFLVENFGLQSYFTCMKEAKLMVGNTSSGISEAASFNKYFINIGDRQIGREAGSNVLSVPFEKDKIKSAISDAIKKGTYQGPNIYLRDGAIMRILHKLKSINI